MSAGIEPYDAGDDVPLPVRLRRRWNSTSRHLLYTALGPIGFLAFVRAVTELIGVDLPRDAWRVVVAPAAVVLVAFGLRAAYVFGRTLASSPHRPMQRVRRWIARTGEQPAPRPELRG